MNRITLLALVVAVTAAGAQDAESATNQLGPCDDPEVGEKVDCGTFRVWEDRDAGGGRSIDLAFQVFRQLGDGESLEPVYLLAGGPGQGATGLGELARGPFAELRRDRELVLVDLRGTGRSRPLECDAEGADENPQQVFGHVFDPDRYRACAERLRRDADLDQYTSDQAIDDLDELRAWLGHERILLWGASYGTRSALVYLRRHPRRVAAAVLDSPAPPGFRAPLDYARDSQGALDRILDGCVADAACRAAFPNLRPALWSLLERLARQSAVVTFEDPLADGQITVRMSRGDFGYALRGLLYRGDSYRRLPRLLYAAATEGDLAPFAAAYWVRSRLLEPAVAEGLHFASLCAEDAAFIAEEEIDAATRGTFLGDYLLREYLEVCSLFELGRLGDDYLDPVVADAPVLILSGTLDPITPPRWGRATARFLPNSVHVTVELAAHGVIGSDCGRALTLAFLGSGGSFAGLDPSCADAGPMEFELEQEPLEAEGAASR